MSDTDKVGRRKQVLGKHALLKRFDALLYLLRESKPDERSEMSRRYAITITELEKVIAYFKMFIVDTENIE